MTDGKNVQTHQLLTLENRERITVTGVLDVGNFDEESIAVKTELGDLCIRGEGLHICAFDVSSGNLTADGHISAIIYTNDNRRGGFFSRLFK